MEKQDVRRMMVEAIAAKVANPGEWLIAARRIAEGAARRIAEGAALRPERCLPLGAVTLETVCHGVADEASKQGTLARLVVAILAFEEASR